MKLGYANSERGWEITYDGIFGPEDESAAFATADEARRQCERTAAEWRAWNRSGLADAPHLDCF